MTELKEEKASTTFGEKPVHTQEKIKPIDDIQIKTAGNIKVTRKGVILKGILE